MDENTAVAVNSGVITAGAGVARVDPLALPPAPKIPHNIFLPLAIPKKKRHSESGIQNTQAGIPKLTQFESEVNGCTTLNQLLDFLVNVKTMHLVYLFTNCSIAPIDHFAAVRSSGLPAGHSVISSLTVGLAKIGQARMLAALPSKLAISEYSRSRALLKGLLAQSHIANTAVSV